MKSSVLLFNRFGMGHGPEDLSHTLVTNYLHLLKDEAELPSFCLFYGEGVKLLCNGSPVIDLLKEIQGRGTTLIACKTCLTYFQLNDQILTGTIGSMSDILTIQMKAGKVITV